MRAIVVGLLSLLVLCAPAAAQERGPIKNAYVLFSSDPLDIASDMTQYFTSRGVSARLFHASTFADQRRTLGAPPNGGQGSGFFIDDNGTLVTNYHVVQGLPNLTVSTPAGMRPATILSASSSLDVAVLSVQGYRPDRFIDLGAMNAVPVGQRIFAIGYPLSDALGVSAKVTDGVVSSLSGLGDDASLMQISVPMQPGNSGGPVVLPTGRAIAIAVSRLSDAYAIQRYGAVPQNVNFAIKIDFARPLLSQFARVTDPSRRASNIEQATAATALVEARADAGADRSTTRDQATSRASQRNVVAWFDYHMAYEEQFSRYYLTSLEVTVEDFETGDLMSRFVWYGAGTKASVVRRAARKLDSDLGLSGPAAR